MMDIETKYQACNLCDALHRNINDNFESVSFEILNNGNIQTKVVLQRITKIEADYIEDILAEFSAKQQTNCVLAPIIEIGIDIPPLKNLIYKKSL